MAQIKPVETDSELEGILELQSRNLEKNISSGELKDQGFVTVHHNKEILAARNKDIPSIIAVDSNSRVIGYPLSMTKRLEIPLTYLCPCLI